MAATELLRRLETRAVAAEQIITHLKKEIEELKQVRGVQNVGVDVSKLQKENDDLKKEIEVWKNKLISLEIAQGVKQVSIPSIKHPITTPTVSYPTSTPQVQTTASDIKENVDKKEDKKEDVDKKENVSEAKPEKVKKEKPAPAPKKQKGGDVEEPPVDVGRLDFRVGRIVNVKKHPDADSLYVEEVDVGEEKPRTVVSGLVKFVPMEEMQNRMVVLLCNLKPAKMRGVTSEAMVMCASTPEKVEVLIPPEGAAPGDLVHVEGYSRVPDPVLNPKKKIFETVAPDLKTSDEKIATYKGAAFTVPGKGVVVSPSLVGVNIK